MSVPRVSVVIPCFNHARHLPETVESLVAQTFEALEVVIVDDGSTDDSAAVAERLIAAHPERSLRLMRQPNSGHPAVARNNGIASSEAEYLLCLDADDRLPPEWIERCVAALDARPECGVAYTDQQDFGASSQYHAVAEYSFPEQTHKNWFGICSLFRRTAWEAVGGWDESIELSEDWDFWIGCGYRGFEAVKVHGTAWLYRTSDDGRFAQLDLAADQRVKAKLVLKRPQLYTPLQRAWARGVLAGDGVALGVPHHFGIIPHPATPALELLAEPIADVRSFATLAFASELVEQPELLRRYAGEFRPDDDATLVIYAPDGDADDAFARLEALTAEIGADMLLFAEPLKTGKPAVDATVDAVLSASDRAVAAPHYDERSIAELRRLADARLARPFSGQG